jgi:multidrug efflux pump subunit AcrA (membrane-fusion protein)
VDRLFSRIRRGATLTTFGWSANEDQAQPVHVAIVQSVAGNEVNVGSAALLEAGGYVVAGRQATVGPKIAGKLRDVLVEEEMHPDWQIPGHVIAVVPMADSTKATFRVRVAIDVKDSRTFPRMSVRVAFLPDAKSGTTSKPQPAGALVPPEAIAAGWKSECGIRRSRWSG